MNTKTASVVALVLAACVGGSKGLSSEDKERLAAYVMTAVPPDARKVDINFDQKVHLVGVKIEPESPKPGTEVKLTHYWRCDEPPEDGWLLFTHVADPVSNNATNLDWSGPLRENRDNKQVFGPSRWERGKIYADSQTFTLPDWGDGMGPEIVIRTGFWKGQSRLRVVAGDQDGENAGIVARIKTGHTPKDPSSELPKANVVKLAADEKIVIDGKLDDKAWSHAAIVGPFVDVGTGKPSVAPVGGSAKLLWDDQNMYAAFEVSDADVVGPYTDAKAQAKDNFWTTTGQPKLWMKDTVEIMVDPDGDGDNQDYYEIQVNPQNKVFHTQYDGYNTPKTDPNGPFGHEDWDPKLKSAVVVRGSLNGGEKDEGYTVEIAIPWAAFSKAKKTPPKSGDVWRMNFYAMENNGGTAWSPILGQGNFHKASRFGRVTWAGAVGEPTPPALTDAVIDAGKSSEAGSGIHPNTAPTVAPARTGVVKLTPKK